jgi:hypothetical protein
VSLTPARDEAWGRVARSVVGNDDLESSVTLLRERLQDGIEGVRRVVRRDNDA